MTILGTVTACLLGFFVGCSRKPPILAPTPFVKQPSEQCWIVTAIVKDLTNLATFAAAPERWRDLPAEAVTVAAGAGAETGKEYAVSVKLPGVAETVTADLRITGSVWSPELYVPLLQAECAHLSLTLPPAGAAAGGRQDAEWLKALSNPLTSEIEARNQRLSGWLQGHPLDAQAHEQAALLLGTLALRENSGRLWNPRGLCNRAAAHLAFARTLRPEASECGQVAGLLIGLLIDTKADCQTRIAALRAQAATHPELGPWITAAAMRNTRDYRLLTNPPQATLLERIEQFRALSEAISSEEAIKRTGNLQPAGLPDWARIVLQGGYGVDSGHRFALPSTGQEFLDAVQVFPEFQKAATAAEFAAVLNVPPGDAVQPGEDRRGHLQVIDRGAWAQYFQRHLLQAAEETEDFLQNKWGVPDEAAKFRGRFGPLFKSLTLYPLCFDFLGHGDGEALFARTAELLDQHPEWVGDGAWSDVVKTVPARYAKNGSWQAVCGAWFSPRLPTGTVYGFDLRTDPAALLLPPPTLVELQRWHDIAPVKYDVCRLYLNTLAPNHHPTVDQYKQVMGALPAYYLRAMWGEAWLVQADPAAYGALMNQAAALDPSYYFALGKYYLEHRMEPEAAQAYQAAIDHDADAVSVSNHCYWLVDYYYDHGQREKAMAVAQQVAEVYSFKGLETMAHLLERMGRVREAESYYEKINERYNNVQPLHAFYAREATAFPEYAEKMKAGEREIFPQGIETVALAELSGKPAQGVLVRDENDLSRQCGLKAGAIVVGLDGKRVLNMNQYSYVRGLTASPELDLLVYQDDRYQEIHAHVPGRRFNLQFTSWP